MRITAPFKKDNIWIDWRTVGLFATNSHLVICPHTKEAVLVDGSGDFPVLRKMFEAYEDLKIKYYLQTHAHLDHVAALDDLFSWHEAPILLHKEEEMLYNNVPMQCQLFGLPPMPTPPPVGQWIKEGDTLTCGQLTIKVIETPGHTPGGVTFMIETGGETFMFCGDTLFAGGIGRTDLPGGDTATLFQSLERLQTYPDETFVFTGHGPATTIGQESRSNPFLQM